MVLNEKTQSLAVEKVKKEMQYAEGILNTWNVNWTEQLLDAYCKSLYNTAMDVVQDTEEKYHHQYKLANVYNPETRIGEPLDTRTIKDTEDKIHECEFGRIDWNWIYTKNSQRYFHFHNNGIIEFSKGVRVEKVKTTPIRISYDTEFNVLTDEFRIHICDDRINADNHTGRIDFYTVEIKDGILTEKLNGFEVIIDLYDNTKKLVVDDRYASAVLGTLKVEDIEASIARMVKTIKGELPLAGLVERIDNYLELIEEDYEMVNPEDPASTLRLSE